MHSILRGPGSTLGRDSEPAARIEPSSLCNAPASRASILCNALGRRRRDLRDATSTPAAQAPREARLHSARCAPFRGEPPFRGSQWLDPAPASAQARTARLAARDHSSSLRDHSSSLRDHSSSLREGLQSLHPSGHRERLVTRILHVRHAPAGGCSCRRLRLPRNVAARDCTCERLHEPAR